MVFPSFCKFVRIVKGHRAKIVAILLQRAFFVENFFLISAVFLRKRWLSLANAVASFYNRIIKEEMFDGVYFAPGRVC